MVRGIAAGVLVIGWIFVAWQNRFHFTAPLVMVELAYTAVVAIVFNMYRVGAAVVAPNEEDDGGASWGLPIGARGELEREKKSLLKAIKEAEFDQLMGKLSKQDAEQMIGTIRRRAIEVIKEIDRIDAGTVGTVRDRIEREVKARIEITSAIDKTTAHVEKKVAHDKATAEAAATESKREKTESRGKKRGKNRGKGAVESSKPAVAVEAQDDKAADMDVVEAKVDAVEAKVDAAVAAAAEAPESKAESKAVADDADASSPVAADEPQRKEVRS